MSDMKQELLKEIRKLGPNPMKWLHWKKDVRRIVLSHAKMARAGRYAIEENHQFVNSIQDAPGDSPAILAAKLVDRSKFRNEQELFIGYLISQMTDTMENALNQDASYRDAVGSGDALEVWKTIRDVIYTRYRDPFEIGKMMDELQALKQGPNEGLEPFITRFNERLELLDTFDVTYDKTVINQALKRGIQAKYHRAMMNVARVYEEQGMILSDPEVVHALLKEYNLERSMATPPETVAAVVNKDKQSKRQQGSNHSKSKSAGAKKQKPATRDEIIAALLQDVEALAARKGNGPKKSSFCCYACGSKDHFVKDCPNSAKKEDWLKKREEYKAKTSNSN